MTAMSLAVLSDGRFIVGLGASGPQVVEAGTVCLWQACDPAERVRTDHEADLPPRRR